MYTYKTFSAIVITTNLAWRACISHFYFANQSTVPKQPNYVLETNFSSTRHNVIRFTFAFSFLYLAFIVARLLQQVLNDTADLAFCVKMGYLICCYSLPLGIQYNTLLKYHETPNFFFKYITFFKEMREKYLLPTEKGAKCRKFFSVFVFVGMAINLQNTAILLVKPNQSHLLTSLLENPKRAPIIFRLPLWVAHVLVWANLWSNLWMYCFHWFTYISCSLYLVKELDINVKNARTYHHLREPSTFLKVLRSMQVLHRFWEISFQHWMCPMHKAIICNLASMALYGSVKLSGPRAVIMGFVNIIALLYLSTLFYKFGQLHERFRKVVKNWRTFPGSSKWARKMLLSFPELGVKIGNFYCVYRTTVINVLWIVLNNTITLFFL